MYNPADILSNVYQVLPYCPSTEHFGITLMIPSRVSSILSLSPITALYLGPQISLCTSMRRSHYPERQASKLSSNISIRIPSTQPRSESFRSSIFKWYGRVLIADRIPGIGALPMDEPSRARLGSTAPDFSAQTTNGSIDFYNWLGNCWGIVLSHPGELTSVCATELSELARRTHEFNERNTKLISISANVLGRQDSYLRDLNNSNVHEGRPVVGIPLIADENKHISMLYDILDVNPSAEEVRAVIIIDPQKTIRVRMSYPAAVGRNIDELLRVLDALQISDRHSLCTPANWAFGDDLLLSHNLAEEEAHLLFPDHVTYLPYLKTIKYQREV